MLNTADPPEASNTNNIITWISFTFYSSRSGPLYNWGCVLWLSSVWGGKSDKKKDFRKNDILLSTSIYETYGMAWGPYSSSSNEPQSFFQTLPGPNLEYFGVNRTKNEDDWNKYEREGETDNKGGDDLLAFRVSRLVPHLAQTDLQNMMMECFILHHFIKED